MEKRYEDIGKHIPEDASVLITWRRKLKKFGVIDKVIKALGSRKITEFGGIEPNPKYETLMRKFAEIVKRDKLILYLQLEAVL